MATVVAQCLVEAKYAENSQSTQYTAAAATKVIIDKFTVSNGTAGAVTLAVNLVASGGAAGGANLVLPAYSVAAGAVYTCPELVGHVLHAGDFISTLAGAATSLVIRVDGRVVS